jgi:Kef-type K+ transport system membrane component KefB/nucleotide-binding universal stress UspA family protein
MRFAQPSEHQVLLFLLQVSLLLLLGRALGQVSRRFGQPAVVGEIAAGVVLGPSVLGKLAPDVFDWLFPVDAVQSGLLFAIGWIGVILLLLVTGFETDLGLIGALGKAAVWVTLGSLLVPFAFGLGGGFVAPDALIGVDIDRPVFALFLATALTISSLPVIAKILGELQLLRRNFGQLTLAVGMANDVVGWVLLGLIAGLASSGEFDVGRLATVVVGLLAFLGVSVLVGQRLFDGILRAMRRQGVGHGGWVTMMIVFALGFGAITQALKVEAVLGAFIAGILIGRSRYRSQEAEDQIEVITTSFAAPIFFALAGLRADLTALSDGTVAVWAVIVFIIASVSKFGGSMLGARIAGMSGREGVALGTALNARGALEIVIATVGLSLGVLNDRSYTIVVIMAIATSMLASPVLRVLTADWKGSPEEEERLAREAKLAGNVVVRPGRVLLASQGGAASVLAAELIGAAMPPENPVTVFGVGAAPGAHEPVVLALGRRASESVVVDGDPVAATVRQAGLGYQLFAAGTLATVAADLPAVVDGVFTSRRDLTVVLVRPARGGPSPIRRVLLPVAGTVQSRAATELAVAIAASHAASLFLLHVEPGIDEPLDAPGQLAQAVRRGAERAGLVADDPVGGQILRQADALAKDAGVRGRRIIVRSATRGLAIVEAARRTRSDLVVIGVTPQLVADRVFLGQTAAHVLAAPDLSVLVVALR